MAQNVVIDIDARTKNFENALDSLTAKVRSTVDQMDKIFASGATNAVISVFFYMDFCYCLPNLKLV